MQASSTDTTGAPRRKTLEHPGAAKRLSFRYRLLVIIHPLEKLLI
jgi:hypothetical protein